VSATSFRGKISSDDLLVPVVRLPTIGRRAFIVAGDTGARVWNDLPIDVTYQNHLCTPPENG